MLTLNMSNVTQNTEEKAEHPNSDEGSSTTTVDFLGSLLSRFKLAMPNPAGEEKDVEKPEQLLPEVSFKGVAEYLASNKCKNIITISGAGISTSAGIPDFRSPGSGLYDNLEKYDLPSPQAIFEIGYFKENPQPFFTLAKELYPGTFKPTWCHYFIKLLEQKGLLLRAYTQNIDTLERVAGISGEKIVEAHGAFHSAHCLECKKEYTQEWVKEKVFNDEIPRCSECESLVKPDIVFFGEALPGRFHELRMKDFEECDLLIVMGTSLKVQPFASLVGSVRDTTPRLLINREKCGDLDPFMALMGFGGGMDFESDNAYRDVAWLGDCDEGCKELCSLLGWQEELETLVKTEHEQINKETKTQSLKSNSPKNGD
ncbi:unnamed protein product [Clavelina lepadiformis]|uniref:NAD-dependent protein deacetylase n=1 Tax=Clavelina lepadiformis TaxID=159417 RepID=A0ABP0F2D9_CLALP